MRFLLVIACIGSLQSADSRIGGTRPVVSIFEREKGPLVDTTERVPPSQDTPVPMEKSALPKAALCVVCHANGSDHGEERPAAGVRYKGNEYYFCNAKEVETFRKDPEGYMPPVLPRPMPDFKLADLTGKTWDASAMKGKLVIVDFWATWCVPCKEMKPILDGVRKKYGERGLEVLSVSIDEKRTELDKHLKKNPFSNPVLHDTGEVWAAWKVRVVPTFLVVKDGMIVEQWSGKRSKKDVEAMIERQLSPK